MSQFLRAEPFAIFCRGLLIGFGGVTLLLGLAAFQPG